MEDELIDDTGFEFGMPTRVEMLKHQCTLLCAELETTRLDLRKAHRDIAKLIITHRDCSTDLTAVKFDHEQRSGPRANCITAKESGKLRDEICVR